MENGTRINKFLSMSGICSRREADERIKQGRVKIDGVVASLGSEVKKNSIVLFDEKVVKEQSKKIYIALNKPIGVVSTMNDQFERNCLVKFIPKKYGKLFHVGRLDMDTSGLIILTNDGELANIAMHPSHETEKEYIVKVNKSINEELLKKLSVGVDIGGYITKRGIAKRIDDNSFSLQIHEGKNRQIRKMCLACGYRVVELQRIREGQICLGNLEAGKTRELTKREIESIKQ